MHALLTQRRLVGRDASESLSRPDLAKRAGLDGVGEGEDEDAVGGLEACIAGRVQGGRAGSRNGGDRAKKPDGSCASRRRYRRGEGNGDGVAGGAKVQSQSLSYGRR